MKTAKAITGQGQGRGNENAKIDSFDVDIYQLNNVRRVALRQFVVLIAEFVSGRPKCFNFISTMVTGRLQVSTHLH